MNKITQITRMNARFLATVDFLKRIARFVLPPILMSLFRITWQLVLVRGRKNANTLEYAPNGWNTPLPEGSGWNSERAVSAGINEWNSFVRNLQDPLPLGFYFENDGAKETRNLFAHNDHMTYAYVLALSAHKKDVVSVLDWGGGSGYYCQIGKAVLPGVALDYHCMEVPLLVELGKQINPEVQWHDDLSCLEQEYDLIVVNGSLQYFQDWTGILQQLARVLKPAGYFYLTYVPVIEKHPTFVAVQQIYRTKMLHLQFNRDKLLQTITGAGLNLMREFLINGSVPVKNAPEQFVLSSWLFQKPFCRAT